MKKQKVVITIISFFCLGTALAQAQYYWYLPEGAGPYFRAGVGPTIFQDGTLKTFSGAFPTVNGPQAPVSYDVGVAADAALGYAVDKYFGIDFESGYIWGRINNVSGYDSNGSTIANVPLLVNGTLSLPIPHTNIVPYVGAGVGGAVSSFEAHGFGPTGGSTFAYGTETDAVFAYQAFAGVRFMLSPSVSVGLGYKYFATGNPTFDYPPNPDLYVGFKGVQTHSILFTLQVNF
jgi:opacity protein-like surface antigen